MHSETTLSHCAFVAHFQASMPLCGILAWTAGMLCPSTRRFVLWRAGSWSSDKGDYNNVSKEITGSAVKDPVSSLPDIFAALSNV